MLQSFTVHSRLFKDIIVQYPNTFKAFCELINNSIQAEARNIYIELNSSEEGSLAGTGESLTSIVVRDDGVGVSKSDFPLKIRQIATDSKVKTGGKGIGRFAGLQIGMVMKIETVSFDQNDKCFYRIEALIDSTKWGKLHDLKDIKMEVNEVKLDGENISSYFTVEITELYAKKDLKRDTNNQPKKLNAKNKIDSRLSTVEIGKALFQEYPDTVFKQDVKFYINNDPLEQSQFIIGIPEVVQEELTTLDGDTYEIRYEFVQINEISASNQVFLRANNGIISTVAHSYEYSLDSPDTHPWYILCDSTYIDEQVDIFRSFKVSDNEPTSRHVNNIIKEHIDKYFQELYKDYYDFDEQLKSDESYPYRNGHASSYTRKKVFGQIAYQIESDHKLLKQKNSIRKMVYALIDRALNENNFEKLLSDVLQLDADTLAHYKKLSQRTSLTDVIYFSEKVSKKIEFLDFLKKLVNSDISKHVLERAELHKMVQENLWVFGEEYKETPILFSDKNLQNNLIALREQYFIYEPTEKDENLVEVSDDKVREITDLFFFNERPVDNDKREIMVVELKAPKVKIGIKEINQAKEYAKIIQNDGKYSQKLSFRVILVSSNFNSSAEDEMGQIDENRPYLIWRSKKPGRDIQVWVLKWSDLIENCHRKLTYLQNTLKVEDREVTDYWNEVFPDVPIEKFESKLVDK